MRQSIETKYLRPINRRGARVKATASGGTHTTVTWDDALSVTQNHTEAARALAEKLGWEGQWFGGGTKRGFVFVLATEPAFTTARDDS